MQPPFCAQCFRNIKTYQYDLDERFVVIKLLVKHDRRCWTLQGDLSKVDRGRTPWLLVLFHVPWYNSNKAHQCEGDEMKAAMEALLHAAGVDVMFAGHVHAYERSVRITRLLTITFRVLIH